MADEKADRKVMTKTALIRSVSKRTGIPIAQVRRVVRSLFNTKGVITNRLMRGYTLVIPGFGRLEPRDTPWKWARNPATGETVRVAPKRKGYLVLSPVVKAFINKGAPQTPDPDARKPKAPQKANGKVVPKKAPPPLDDENTPDPEIDDPTNADGDPDDEDEDDLSEEEELEDDDSDEDDD